MSWLEVSAGRLAANYEVLREVAGVPVLAVVKADGYGHEAAVCAPVLARAGVEWLGVTDAWEGGMVRVAMEAAGIARQVQPRVLVMCGLLLEDAETVVREDLTSVIWTVEQMSWLSAAMETVRPGTTLAVHLEIDSGMTRQGIAPGAGLEVLLAEMYANKVLRLDGVLTHFASAEVAGSAQTEAQWGEFALAMRQVRASGMIPSWVHVGNTSGVDLSRAMVKELERVSKGSAVMVRAGLGLYGYCLPLEGEGMGARLRGEVLPVMCWKTRVTGVRVVEAGVAVGYGGTFVTEQRMKLALLPVGYADGLRRELSGAGWVMVAGKRAGIVGRVSMNLTVVDVTGMEAAVGDEVVVLGEGCTAEDHARLCGTIAYEILCGVRAEARLVR